MTPTGPVDAGVPETSSVPAAQNQSRRADFLISRKPRWDELATALKVTGKRQPEDLRRIGTLYRSAAADLALARREFPSDSMLLELEQTLLSARAVVYPREPGNFSIKDFYRNRYWRLVAERPWPLLASVALLVIPTIAVFAWALRDPDRASTLMGNRFGGGRESWGDQGYSANQQSSIAASIFVNNIRVSLLAFAAGITAGLGTAYLLIFNGALLGMVAGISTHQGHGDVAFTLIYAHGFLELSIIAVTAAAGMRMGWAIVDPGLLPRRVALREASVRAVEIVIGTIPFFVLAGLIEGFFTPAGFGPVWSGIVGTFFGAGYWALVWRRGRQPKKLAASGPLAVG
jgi:uncharacterized membrane protein SpoIIM required for sporulation